MDIIYNINSRKINEKSQPIDQIGLKTLFSQTKMMIENISSVIDKQFAFKFIQHLYKELESYPSGTCLGLAPS